MRRPAPSHTSDRPWRTVLGGYPYREDCDAKQDVRHRLYCLVAQYLPRRADGCLVTLTGHEAAEVPYLRDFLGVAARRVWFVDADPVACRTARTAWPAAGNYQGKLDHFLAEGVAPQISFLNFDFMGPYTSPASTTVQAGRGRLVSGAIVALTFLRCRDHRWSQRIFDLAKGIRDPMERRWVGTKAALDEDLGVTTTLLGAFEYKRGRSPMGNLVVQLP